MKRIAAVAALALSLSALRSSHAGAPFDQYNDFTGTDTQITDRKTALTWLRRPTSGVSLDASATFCNSLAPAGTWRVPSAKEALTLVDEDAHQEYVGSRLLSRFIDQAAFGTYVDDQFWTSSKEGGQAFVLDIKFATLTLQRTDNALSVRCVKNAT